MMRPPSKKCADCGGQPSAGVYACKACGKASYCNRSCQAKHWPKHKQHCAPRAGSSSVVVACHGCGRRDPAPASGFRTLRPCACSKVLYCSSACRQGDRDAHKPYCAPATAMPVMWQVKVDDAGEGFAVNVSGVETPGMDDPDPRDFEAQQRALAGLSGVPLADAVDKLARRCKGVYSECASRGDTIGEAVARNARAIAYMRDNRIVQAKQQLDMCEALVAQFARANGAAAFTDEEKRAHTVHTASISFNAASVNAQVLCEENFVDSQGVAVLPRGAERRERSWLLANRIVRELQLWVQLKEWDRCVGLNVAAIGFVATDAPTREARSFMLGCATHAMELLRDHREEIETDWRGEEQRLRAQMTQWAL